MVTWTHLTQHPKLDRFRRFCTTHGRESLYFTIGHHSHPLQNCSFTWKIWTPILYIVPWATLVNNQHPVASGILVHPAIWPQQTWTENWGGCAPFLEGELGPHLTQCARPRPTSVPSGILIHPDVWSQQMGRKLGLCPFWRAGFPSSTISPGPEAYLYMPSSILIHPTVWLQYTNVTNRQDRTDRTTVP